MDIDIENLPDDPATLKKMLSQVMSRNQYLEEKFRIAQHKQFGKSTDIGCWAHSRRKFMEDKKGAGKKGSGKADGHSITSKYSTRHSAPKIVFKEA